MNIGKISFFNAGITQTKPDQQLELTDILSFIKRPMIASWIKALRMETDAEKQEALKKKLPYCTFSGRFEHRKKDDPAFQHSGLLCLDFDHLDNVKAVRRKVEADPATLLSFVSPRGQGLKVIVRIPADKAGHEKIFRDAAFYFKSKYGLTADEACKDFSRACFLTHDPDLFYNSSATVFDPLALQAIETERAASPVKSEASRERGADDKKVAKGSRNTAMTTLAGKLRRNGLRPEEIMAALKERNAWACDPPLEECEIEGVARSACRYEPAKGQEPEVLRTESAAALMERSIEPIHWIVSDFLPEGLAILAGRPKMGKSWMALDLGLSCAVGGSFMDKYQTAKGQVLYLVLEDSDRRMKQRIEKLLAGGKAPEGFHFSTKLSPLDQGGMEQLDAWVKAHPGTKLVVLDTLGRIRPAGKKSEILYQADTAFLAPLQAFAMENRLAIVGVHHQRKGSAEDVLDTISGSTGLVGVADAIYVLQRETRQRADGILAIESRDFESEPIGLELNKDRMAWRYVGPAKIVMLSRQRDGILETLNGGPLRVTEIADALRKKPTAISNLLAKLAADGLVAKNQAGLWERSIDAF